MAVSALHSAATGLKGLSTEIDVLANNLANVNTVGFKGSRVNFEDLLYQHKKQPGVENALGDRTPAGLQVGGGVRISNTQYDFTQGDARGTEEPLDLLIDGDGFFRIELPADQGGVGYTRAGNFFRNSEGDVVLGNSQGLRLADGINIPDGTPPENISISAEGVLQVTDDATGAITPIGQITLATFINKEGLKSIGGNIFVETDASGPPIEDLPNASGLGGLIQGFLESSNVDPVQELVALIKTQRAFELNSQTIQAADEVMQVVGNLRR